MNCTHGNEHLNDQDIRVERAAGCKNHPYVICANCGTRVWVHVIGQIVESSQAKWLIQRCENPPIHYPTLSRVLGREMKHFKPRKVTDN